MTDWPQSPKNVMQAGSARLCCAVAGERAGGVATCLGSHRVTISCCSDYRPDPAGIGARADHEGRGRAHYLPRAAARAGRSSNATPRVAHRPRPDLP